MTSSLVKKSSWSCKYGASFYPLVQPQLPCSYVFIDSKNTAEIEEACAREEADQRLIEAKLETRLLHEILTDEDRSTIQSNLARQVKNRVGWRDRHAPIPQLPGGALSTYKLKPTGQSRHQWDDDGQPMPHTYKLKPAVVAPLLKPTRQPAPRREMMDGLFPGGWFALHLQLGLAPCFSDLNQSRKRQNDDDGQPMPSSKKPR
jgi:hypothetical protein